MIVREHKLRIDVQLRNNFVVSEEPTRVAGIRPLQIIVWRKVELLGRHPGIRIVGARSGSAGAVLEEVVIYSLAGIVSIVIVKRDPAIVIRGAGAIQVLVTYAVDLRGPGSLQRTSRIIARRFQK